MLQGNGNVPNAVLFSCFQDRKHHERTEDTLMQAGRSMDIRRLCILDQTLQSFSPRWTSITKNERRREKKVYQTGIATCPYCSISHKGFYILYSGLEYRGTFEINCKTSSIDSKENRGRKDKRLQSHFRY